MTDKEPTFKEHQRKAASKGWDALSEEQRTARALKGHATRRAKQIAAEKAKKTSS